MLNSNDSVYKLENAFKPTYLSYLNGKYHMFYSHDGACYELIYDGLTSKIGYPIPCSWSTSDTKQIVNVLRKKDNEYILESGNKIYDYVFSRNKSDITDYGFDVYSSTSGKLASLSKYFGANG